MNRSTKKQSAGIEYSGLAGISASCKEGVMRLLQFGDRITGARILSCSKGHCPVHCLLLTVDSDDLFAVSFRLAAR
jgi:CelD/BcsL family acetyltransferase involved in cellulose biosynthesis